MRSDLIIGILVSLLFHGGFLFGSKLFRDGPEEIAPPKKEEVLELMEMPELEPEEPDIVESDEPVTEVVDLAPPSILDVPTVVPVNAFVQPVQPPPPPGMQQNTGVVNIPVHRATVSKSGLSNVFNLSDLDQRPTVRFQPGPVYPFEMRRAGINGEVTVGFIVDSEGNTRDAYVVKSSQREFDAAAIQAVMKWKFKPGRKGGRAVNTRMVVPIVFNLKDE